MRSKAVGAPVQSPPATTGQAMFDVRPVTQTGQLDFEKLQGLPDLVDLGTGRVESASFSQVGPEAVPPAQAKHQEPQIGKDTILRELEESLSDEGDSRGLLARLGAAFKEHVPGVKPRYRPILARKNADSLDYRRIMSEIARPIRHVEEPRPFAQAKAKPSVEQQPDAVPARAGQQSAKAAAIENWYGVPASPPAVRLAAVKNFAGPKRSRHRTLFFALAMLLAGGAVIAFVLGNRVIQEGKAAVQSLESAKENLEQFNFGEASKNFLLAYEEFSKAGESMSVFGANIGGVLGELPGGGKLKSANNLIESGKLIAQAGQAMSDVVKALSRTGVVLNPNSNSRVLLAEIINPLKKALELSDTNLKMVSTLMAQTDESVIPEDKREMFSQVMEKLPQFQELVQEGIDHTLFFEDFVAKSEPRTYLLLFQNSSELRPTGGFPGSYGIFTLENGRVKDFVADDVYDIDGQLSEVIVPPLQLQHITPNWAMRDAAWFIDFPTSARKVMEFYAKEAKHEVHGVITINPQIMAELLRVVGPIEMPAYGLTLTGENFLSAVQSEVEYGENKKINQPKKIIVDLAPLFIKKLYSADRSKWLEIFNVFTAAMERKDLLMYFRDPKLQKFVTDKGLGGQVVNNDGDYLMVTFSNIKGAKTDAMTESSLNVQTALEKDGLTHKLTIIRRHDGGKSKFGFYNKQNPSYVRILVPKGSELLSVSGNSTPHYQPMLNYPKTDFKRDPELQTLELSGRRDSRGVTTYQESGKTGFGFWMIIDPGEIKTVELEYRVPDSLARNDYEMYIQKQPGLQWKNFEFTVTLPDGADIKDATPVLTGSRGRYGFTGTLEKDIPVSIEIE